MATSPIRVIEPEVVTEQHAELERLAKFGKLLDSSIEIGTSGYRIGLDPIIGIIPGIGDLIGTILSSYIVFQSARLGASRLVLARMVVNVALESLIGVIPVVGDLFDFVYKANERNVALLRRFLSAHPRPALPPDLARGRLLSTLLVLFVVCIAVCGLSLYLLVTGIGALVGAL